MRKLRLLIAVAGIAMLSGCSGSPTAPPPNRGGASQPEIDLCLGCVPDFDVDPFSDPSTGPTWPGNPMEGGLASRAADQTLSNQAGPRLG